MHVSLQKKKISASIMRFFTKKNKLSLYELWDLHSFRRCIQLKIEKFQWIYKSTDFYRQILLNYELRMATSTRLKDCHSFTSPGGPMYPTRAHLISLFFRLLYPWHWPASCWNFIMDCVKAVLYSLLGLIYSSLEKLRKPKF
ncbi:hypothetical protein D8674_013839 [Pyrus ussuriensis x Pyrus communis]|uniref:Uncharacterized protein n=1 Tax=Pyrus ussuriensis x Pyrus communis TaxID=2448454 RepID=A0A5N5GXZ3_9ROSA|nr:hypothetical protein D8674_013839 [Pyrus ussuriensis x Pyrus communis]